MIALPLLAFLAAHTGFGLVLIPVLVSVLVIQTAGEWRAGRNADLRFSVGTVVAVIILSSTFFWGYHASESFVLHCPEGTSPGVVAWISWPIVMLSRSFGMSGTSGFWWSIGALLFVLPALGAIGAGLARGWSVTTKSGPSKEWAAYVVPVVLIGYSLAFSGASAPARICGGLQLARESRYVTHMIPFALGLYFFYLLLRPDRSKSTGIGVRVAGAVFAALVLLSSSGLTPFDRVWIEENRTGKSRWAGCMVGGGDAVQCEAYANYTIFTVPEDLEERIEFLRDRRLSLFSEER